MQIRTNRNERRKKNIQKAEEREDEKDLRNKNKRRFQEKFLRQLFNLQAHHCRFKVN
jgi:hypothetical protein